MEEEQADKYLGASLLDIQNTNAEGLNANIDDDGDVTTTNQFIVYELKVHCNIFFE